MRKRYERWGEGIELIPLYGRARALLPERRERAEGILTGCVRGARESCLFIIYYRGKMVGER